MLKRGLAVALPAVLLLATGCANQSVGDSPAPSGAGAVAYPTRTLQIMAPAGAGGGCDTTARSMQKTLQDAGLLNGQSAEVRNVTGAAGTIGLAELVTSHQKDPHQLMVTGLVMVGGVVTNKSPVDLGKTTPIATLTAESEVIVVRSDSKYTSLKQLVDDVKTNPAAVKWVAAPPVGPTRSSSACSPRPPAPTPRRWPRGTWRTPAAARPRRHCCPAT